MPWTRSASATKPATSTGSIDDLKRKETGFHPQLVWAHPLTDKVDLAVSAGPSFVKLSQDVIETLTVPVDTQTAVPSVGREKATAKGIHIGADVTYTIPPRYGAGVFLRYVNASVDLPTSQNVKRARKPIRSSFARSASRGRPTTP